MGYSSEAIIRDRSCERIYFKKAVEHNPSPISRICHLRSYPTHLLEPVEGHIIHLNGLVDGPFIEGYNDVVEDVKLWDQDS